MVQIHSAEYYRRQGHVFAPRFDTVTPQGESVLGTTDPETASRLFGIDTFTVEELQLVSSSVTEAVVSVFNNPANGVNARAACGHNDTDLFVQAQLFGEIPGELL